MENHVLEHILDGREEPSNLPFALLKKITNSFSEEREIGQGGFATVYKTKDLYQGVLPNGNVAIKRIKNGYTIDEKLFYREVNSLLNVNHQNIVRFLGFCANTEQTAIKIEGSKHIYAEIRERLLCFEYIGNGSLQKYIAGMKMLYVVQFISILMYRLFLLPRIFYSHATNNEGQSLKQ
jgi:serine/threonine protein kinase